MNRWLVVLPGLVCLPLAGCKPSQVQAEPSIVFTKIPPSGEGSAEKLLEIGGRVTGARSGEQIVIYAHSGPWWVQPLRHEPFTTIQPDLTWKNSTHPGSEYAALLVTREYRPPGTLEVLPEAGGAVRAVASVVPTIPAPVDVKTVQFSGYEWRIRQTASDPGGTRNYYDPSNAWTDSRGFLHLRIAGNPTHWTSAEINLSRNLGYGSYRFVLQDVSHLEPGAVFSMLTWDDSGPQREMDIEVSRWGEPDSKNTQFVVQPYHVAANTVRFMTPPGRISYMLKWEPGRAWYQAIRGAPPGGKGDVVAEHVFTSGIPSPGNESVHMNLYVFWNKDNPLRNGTEVIVEKFEYLP